MGAAMSGQVGHAVLRVLTRSALVRSGCACVFGRPWRFRYETALASQPLTQQVLSRLKRSASHKERVAALAQRVVAAREALLKVAIPHELRLAISRVCSELRVRGLGLVRWRGWR